MALLPFGSPPQKHPVPITQGGTGSTTQNFVDLTTAQTVGGAKSLTGVTSITASTATNVPLTISSASSQSADLLDIKDSSGNILSGFNNSGNLGIGITNPTSPLMFGNYGTVKNPTIALANNTGWYGKDGYTDFAFTEQGNTVLSVWKGGAFIPSNNYFGWASSSGGDLIGVTTDTRIYRSSAGVASFGTATNNDGGSIIAGNIGVGSSTFSQKANIASGALGFQYMGAPPACSAQLANLGAGNVPNGSYVYRVTFVNAIGQSVGGGISNSVTVTDNTTNGQIQVTMPISSEPSVTARRLWRSNNGGSTWLAFSMNGNESYNNNVDTVFIDNLASPSDNFGNYNFNIATDSGALYAGSNLILKSDSGGNASIGTSLTITGGRNTDKSGNLSFGVGINNTYKSGIFVADNFNQSSFGAYISSYNSANTISNNFFGGRSLLTYSIYPYSGQGFIFNAGNSAVAGNYNIGNYYSEINTIDVSNTATLYNYNALNYLEGTGSATNYIAYNSLGQFATTGSSIANVYDFYADEYEAQGTGGTITNRYGLYINFDNTGVTNAYGIYQKSNTVQNYFAGPVSISKLNIPTGTNASAGTSTLVAGTVTVSTTAVTANSLINLTVQTPGGTQGFLSIGTVTAGTSFVINSTSATETSTVMWLIVN